MHTAAFGFQVSDFQFSISRTRLGGHRPPLQIPTTNDPPPVTAFPLPPILSILLILSKKLPVSPAVPVLLSKNLLRANFICRSPLRSESV